MVVVGDITQIDLVSEKDSGLKDTEVSNFSTGMIMGSGGPSIENVILAAYKTRAKRISFRWFSSQPIFLNLFKHIFE